MRQRITFLLLALCLLGLTCKSALAQDTWTFSILVAVEKQTAEYYQQAYGKNIRQIVKDQLATVNANFNSGKGFKGKFNFQADSIYIYEGDPGRQIFSSHPGYLYRLVISGFYDNKIGGGWYGGYKTIYHSWAWNNGEGPFGKGATDGLTHEFGHARGALDIYGARVEGRNNPINQQTFEPVSSVMNFPYDNIVWDEFTVNLLNSTADKPVEGEDYITKIFPMSIQARAVDTQGKALGDAYVEVYPVKWFSYSVDPQFVERGTTDIKGIFQFFRNPFQPATVDYPWHIKYPNLLIKATYNATTVYKWMPVYEVQNDYFRNGANSVFTTDIVFPQTEPALKITSVSATTLCPGQTVTMVVAPAVALDPDETFSLVLINSNGSEYAIKSNQHTTTLSGPLPYLAVDPKLSYWLKVISVKKNAQTEAYAVTLRPFPEPPATQMLGLCLNSAPPTLSASGKNLLWYTLSAPNSGSATAPVINTSQPGAVTYYVSQTVDGCESPKSMVQITVSPVPEAPGVTAAKAICQFSAPETLTATGTGLVWYDSDGKKLSAAPTVNTDKAAAYSYQVAQSNSGCEGPKATLSVTVRGRAVATLSGSQTIVEGQSASLSIALAGEGPWTFTYRDSTATGAGPIQTVQTAATSTTIAVKPTRTTAYYLTSVSNGCGTGTLVGGTVVITVNPLLGLEDPLPAGAVEAFPIPAATTLTVRINGLLASQPATLAVISLSGQILLQQESSSATTTLPLEGLPAGTYLLRVSLGNRTVARRIMKR